MISQVNYSIPKILSDLIRHCSSISDYFFTRQLIRILKENLILFEINYISLDDFLEMHLCTEINHSFTDAW